MRRLGWCASDEPGIRDALDELIEEAGNENEEPLGQDQRTLLANILSARDRSVEDVMVPRADIVAVDRQASSPRSSTFMTSSGHSRLPVYRETLDDAIGMVHIKDVLAWRGRDSQFQLSKVLRRVLFVAPSMQVLHLLLEMRASRTHMALVVDEFGGVDGLITIEDLVEEIVGEIADEHDKAMSRPSASFPTGHSRPMPGCPSRRLKNKWVAYSAKRNGTRSIRWEVSSSPWPGECRSRAS